ncbi:MAG: hypothetical protein M1825_002853 [Sarcosagium campestre]|nr:MAG: hypothetical protein M1825_002853 [Sarcosagium campestre]
MRKSGFLIALSFLSTSLAATIIFQHYDIEKPDSIQYEEVYDSTVPRVCYGTQRPYNQLQLYGLSDGDEVELYNGNTVVQQNGKAVVICSGTILPIDPETTRLGDKYGKFRWRVDDTNIKNESAWIRGVKVWDRSVMRAEKKFENLETISWASVLNAWDTALAAGDSAVKAKAKSPEDVKAELGDDIPPELVESVAQEQRASVWFQGLREAGSTRAGAAVDMGRRAAAARRELAKVKKDWARQARQRARGPCAGWTHIQNPDDECMIAIPDPDQY